MRKKAESDKNSLTLTQLSLDSRKVNGEDSLVVVSPFFHSISACLGVCIRNYKPREGDEKHIHMTQITYRLRFGVFLISFSMQSIDLGHEFVILSGELRIHL